MPLFLLGLIAGWFMHQPEASASSTAFTLPQRSTAKPAAAKGKVTVKIGPARILSQSELRSVPLASRSPTADAKLITDAAKQAGLKLPDQTAAKKSAQSVADNVRSNGAKYDVHAVQAYQLQAGLKNTRGSYTSETIASLRKNGAVNVPAKVYARATTAPYAVKA